MNPEWLTGIAAVAALIGGLAAWGAKKEVETLRSEMATLRAEIRASIAESTLEFYRQVNGNYVKKDICKTVHAAAEDRMVKVEQSVEGME